MHIDDLVLAIQIVLLFNKIYDLITPSFFFFKKGSFAKKNEIAASTNRNFIVINPISFDCKCSNL